MDEIERALANPLALCPVCGYERAPVDAGNYGEHGTLSALGYVPCANTGQPVTTAVFCLKDLPEYQPKKRRGITRKT